MFRDGEVATTTTRTLAYSSLPARSVSPFSADVSHSGPSRYQQGGPRSSGNICLRTSPTITSINRAEYPPAEGHFIDPTAKGIHAEPGPTRETSISPFSSRKRDGSSTSADPAGLLRCRHGGLDGRGGSGDIVGGTRRRLRALLEAVVNGARSLGE